VLHRDRGAGLVAVAGADQPGHVVLDDEAKSPGRSGAPAPKNTVVRAIVFGARPFFTGTWTGGGMSWRTAASSRSTTITARRPKMRALAAA
jgi:hypothetical protein